MEDQCLVGGKVKDGGQGRGCCDLSDDLSKLLIYLKCVVDLFIDCSSFKNQLFLYVFLR